ncbi:hypothetical protein N0B44_27765 [Roseibacterium beibuensis]|uniref:Uncharacterized protein n=2 Tax=[Roseibacterium] beibuensis TaxID=1193142 RepID=A0ABP9LR00_9RHOB|nr:hypothetical protein [Roseibacterium beibuensis]MCS6626725.1 hypothetical protein [Roseibacterium beibuensis]
MIGVTFNIHYDATYSERYDDLHKALERFGIEEARTTSCLFLNTDDARAVETALYGALDYRKDKAVVFTTYQHTFKYFGPT